MHTLDFERITAEKLGGVAWVLDALEEQLATTGRLATARERIALLRGELEAARLLSFRGAWLLDRGEPAAAASAMAKLAGARVTQRVADEACDLLELDGLADGEPASPVEGRVAALYRASVGSTISGGTAEVQQLVIARRGLGL
jgi:alkylation response protein AidB-like acyl-CoA dehydrogenase